MQASNTSCYDVWTSSNIRIIWWNLSRIWQIDAQYITWLARCITNARHVFIAIIELTQSWWDRSNQEFYILQFFLLYITYGIVYQQTLQLAIQHLDRNDTSFTSRARVNQRTSALLIIITLTWRSTLMQTVRTHTRGKLQRLKRTWIHQFAGELCNWVICAETLTVCIHVYIVNR